MTPAGLLVRPTSDRVREALFDILGDRIRGARFLDLFAGSGAIGIEALSRGAAEIVLIEDGREALRALEKNLEALGLSSRATILRASWPGALKPSAASGRPESRSTKEYSPRGETNHAGACARFSIVFADPPYGDAPYVEILESVSVPGLLEQDAIVIVEHEARATPPPAGGQLRLHRIASYGRAALAFYHRER